MYKSLYLIIPVLILLIGNKAVYAVDIGVPAPNFTLQDTLRGPLSLSYLRGKYVVLEWFNPDCVRVQRHYQKKTMQTIAKQVSNVRWLAINSTYYMNREDNIRWKDSYHASYLYLSDFSGEVAKLYQVTKTPEIYVIDPKGIVIYHGAIDNDPFGLKDQPFNYVRAALKESQAGKHVTHSETVPYGCFIKILPD